MAIKTFEELQRAAPSPWAKDFVETAYYWRAQPEPVKRRKSGLIEITTETAPPGDLLPTIPGTAGTAGAAGSAGSAGAAGAAGAAGTSVTISQVLAAIGLPENQVAIGDGLNKPLKSNKYVTVAEDWTLALDRGLFLGFDDELKQGHIRGPQSGFQVILQATPYMTFGAGGLGDGFQGHGEHDGVAIWQNTTFGAAGDAAASVTIWGGLYEKQIAPELPIFARASDGLLYGRRLEETDSPWTRGASVAATTIMPGDPVAATGQDFGVLAMNTALAATPARSWMLGVSAEGGYPGEISGYVRRGPVEFDTQAFTGAAGSQLWLQPAGGLNTTKPSISNATRNVIAGTLLVKAELGKIYVDPVNFPFLHELSGVNAAAPADKQILSFSTASNRWENRSLTSADISGGPWLPLVAGPSSPLAGTLHGTSLNFAGWAADAPIAVAMNYSNAFAHAITVVNFGLTAGQRLTVDFGQSAFTNNQANFGFVYAGAGSTANKITLGLYGNNDLVTIAGTGVMTVRDLGTGFVRATSGALSASALVAADIPALDASKITTGTFGSGRMPAFTGDVTTPAGSTVTTLANSGVSNGGYGSGTAIPVLSIDAKGRITAASSVTVTPAWANITGKPAVIGTVTSVGLNAPTLMTASGSPVTGSGSLSLAWNGLSTDLVRADGTTIPSSTFVTGGPYLLATNPQWFGLMKSTAGTLALEALLAGGILKATAGTGVLALASVGDFPTLNQNTTGSAAKWTTPRTLTIGASAQTIDGTTDRTFSLAAIGAQAAGTYLTPSNVSGAANQIAFFTGANSVSSDIGLTRSIAGGVTNAVIVGHGALAAETAFVVQNDGTMDRDINFKNANQTTWSVRTTGVSDNWVLRAHGIDDPITVARAGGSAITFNRPITANGRLTLVGVESNNVANIQNVHGAITTNSPVPGAASIRQSLSFRWYSTDWQIGNIRGGATDSAGFGITVDNNNLRWRVTNGTTYDYNNLDVSGAVTASGSARIGVSSTHPGHACFAHSSFFNTSGFGVIQTNNGDLWLNCASGREVGMCVNDGALVIKTNGTVNTLSLNTYVNGFIQPSDGVLFPTHGSCGIFAGNADNATHSAYNLKIKSHWGIGFESHDNITRTILDTRTGNFSTQGIITVGTGGNLRGPTNQLDLYAAGDSNYGLRLSFAAGGTDVFCQRDLTANTVFARTSSVQFNYAGDGWIAAKHKGAWSWEASGGVLPFLGPNEWCFLVCDVTAQVDVVWTTNGSQPVRVRSGGRTYNTPAGGNTVDDGGSTFYVTRTTCILMGPTDPGTSSCCLIPF